MNVALPLAGPGWDWLPRAWRTRAGWATVGCFALWGPLVGGAPYAVFVFTLPFMYLFGLVPAVFAGLLFAAWLHAPTPRAPNAAWRAGVGALCGAAGCALTAWLFVRNDGPSLGGAFALLALHGIPAGAVVGALRTGSHPGVTRPIAPAGGRESASAAA